MHNIFLYIIIFWLKCPGSFDYSDTKSCLETEYYFFTYSIKKNNTLNFVLEKPTNYVFVLIVSTKSHLKRDEGFHPDQLVFRFYF